MTAALLSPQQVDAFFRDGFLVLRGFYDVAIDIEPIQRGIHRIIALVCAREGLPCPQEFSPATFDSGYATLIKKNRALGGVVYDAAKQLTAFTRWVNHPDHERIVSQLRKSDTIGVCAGGSGIRIDNPGEERFRAEWHQEYPAQLRSMDGVNFWSPLVAVTDEVGPVEFCPGSHALGPLQVHLSNRGNPDKSGAYGLTIKDRDEIVSRFPIAAPPTDPGDLVILDFLTLHQSGHNRSNRARWSMQARYFNFLESTGLRIGWKGSFAAGVDFADVHPELVAS